MRRVLPFLLVLLLVGVWAGSALAQRDAAPARTDAQLLLDLGDDERSLEAVRTLTHRGEAGVATLLAAIGDPSFRGDERRFAVAIYALGKLGDRAAAAAPLLLDAMPEAHGDVLRNLLWALGEVGPKAQADGVDVLGRLEHLVPMAIDDQCEWSFVRARISLGTAMDSERAAELLQLRDGDYVSLAAVGSLLARLAPGAAVPRDELRAAWRRSADEARQWGGGYRRIALELARAVVVHLPDTPDATAASALLVHHFDVDVRLEAAMQLGRSPAGDQLGAVAALQLSLTDGSVHVRREAVTALGMIGPAAADALPALESLASDPDPQLRARAAAAVRAIRRPAK